MNNKSKAVAASIIFSSILIAGSLVFLGMQLGSPKTTEETKVSVAYEDIEKGIERYVQAQETEYAQQEEQTTTISYNGDIIGDSAILGDPDAPISLIEFSDFQCPFCRSFYNESLSEIKEKYIDTGKVKLVYKHFPLSFHDDATKAALATECARDQGDDVLFFQMHDKIFDGQNKLGQGTVKIPEDSLIQYAQDLNLDLPQFEKCLADESKIDAINEEIQLGQQLGISGTPGFILNGKMIEGAQPFYVFEQAIDKALANK